MVIFIDARLSQLFKNEPPDEDLEDMLIKSVEPDE